jgi:hypothetical protein
MDMSIGQMIFFCAAIPTGLVTFLGAIFSTFLDEGHPVLKALNVLWVIGFLITLAILAIVLLTKLGVFLFGHEIFIK